MYTLFRYAQRNARQRLQLLFRTYAEKPKVESEEGTRKVFSGIQPTGQLHLGNYLGAVKKWIDLQSGPHESTFCIVDMHSITLLQDPIHLRENILEMAATMIACGISFEKSTVFVQSAVKEHTELAWILGCFSTMARLGHLPQYKEKMRAVKDVPLGVFVYPVLQAADIMLYKATDVPVGEDQLQHIQLTQHLARIFNTRYGFTFPICQAIIDDKAAARIRSLRDPTKKMSKSDPDVKATINLIDEPDTIVEKVKKAMTDHVSDVSYNPHTRAGVSNLIAIHSLVSGQPIKDIVTEAKTIDTGLYKARVSEAIVEHLRPIRAKIRHHMINRNEIVYLLEIGAEKARAVAAQTLAEVKHKMGLGADYVMPPPIQVIEEPKISAVREIRQLKEEPVMPKPIEKVPDPVAWKSEKPMVPKQAMRVEKRRDTSIKFNINIEKRTEQSMKQRKMKSIVYPSGAKATGKKDESQSPFSAADKI